MLTKFHIFQESNRETKKYTFKQNIQVRLRALQIFHKIYSEEIFLFPEGIRTTLLALSLRTSISSFTTRASSTTALSSSFCQGRKDNGVRIPGNVEVHVLT